MRHEVNEGDTIWEDGAVAIRVISARDGHLVVDVTAKPFPLLDAPPLPDVAYLDGD